ncbi:maleate cis-trans isomerase family protein [Pseudogracilibacillus auburnensis]|uniref:maleate cis-trans isomerase family protein n=1 Tax=Pseudogracilibacillus auburnensis TaxID=1494959 RepID=UPI001A9689B9|nr:aspartate/glutamate racemase family protein [Pseudogracilibacillus auburnensis]MBO1002102.1 aspartate/glutamate racemase family protein [Pseudogracilibacillus auburnensis]
MGDLPYGWRAKIGLIYIASAYSMEVEFYHMAPKGVTTHTTRIALSDQPEHFSIDDLSSLEEDAIRATRLLAQAPLNVIAFGCTSGSFVNGVKYDRQMINRMENIANIPCTTTMTAVMEATKALQVKHIAIATPYSEEVNKLAHRYFTESGLTVTNITGLGIMNDYEISNLDSNTIYRMAINANTDDADALFISCTGLQAVHMIQELEEDLQKPVITSNQATFWHSLRLSGVGTQIKGFGELFYR